MWVGFWRKAGTSAAEPVIGLEFIFQADTLFATQLDTHTTQRHGENKALEPRRGREEEIKVW